MSLHRWLVGPSTRSGVQSSYLPHAEKGSSTEAANKEVACELEICGKKRKQVRGDYHHYTVPRSQSVPATAERKRLSRSTLWNSAILFQKAR